MENITKTFKTLIVIPAVFFGLFTIHSFFSKILGVMSFTQELFFSLLDLYILAIPFILVLATKENRGRVLFLLLGLIYAFLLIVIQKSPQMDLARFYYQTKNHIMLNNLKSSEVAFISFDNVVFSQPKEVESIVEVLKHSTWYSPNHESRGQEVSMIIWLRDGSEVHFKLCRFSNEDSADLLFTRPREAGYWADGNAYVPKLPSTLENLGYRLPSDE